MSINRDLTPALLQLVRDLADQLHPGSDFAQSLGIDHSLERDYGLDSLSRAELVTRIESELGVSLEVGALSQAETPHDLLRACSSPAPASAATAYTPEPEPARDDSRIEYPPATLATPWSTCSTGTPSSMASGCWSRSSRNTARTRRT